MRIYNINIILRFDNIKEIPKQKDNHYLIDPKSYIETNFRIPFESLFQDNNLKYCDKEKRFKGSPKTTYTSIGDLLGASASIRLGLFRSFLMQDKPLEWFTISEIQRTLLKSDWDKLSMLNKDLAQVFTPAPVATFMMNWLCQFQPSKIYDPCYGGGAFYHALENKNTLFEATEIDPRFTKESFVTQADYLVHLWENRYESIVCNPPYMKISKIENKNQVLDLFYKYMCQKFSGYNNLATLFLMKALYQLDAKGQLAFIMPFEFLSSNYGIVIKRILKELQCEVSFIRLTCEKEIFPTVTTSVVIVLVNKAQTSDYISFYTIRSLDDLPTLTGSHFKVNLDSLDPSTKWFAYFQSSAQKTELYNGYEPILKYGKFARGIATGCDDFFILKPSELKQYGLTQDDCIPCLAKSKDLTSNIFNDEDFEKLVQNDRKVFLVNLEKNNTKEVQNYIKLGESLGICGNYTLRNRTPWYKLEKRGKSIIWLGVFSRNTFKLVKNNTNLVTLTTIHGFFPNHLGLKYQDQLFEYLSSDEGLLQIKSLSRKSANNLNVVQPGDLNKLKVPKFWG